MDFKRFAFLPMIFALFFGAFMICSTFETAAHGHHDDSTHEQLHHAHHDGCGEDHSSHAHCGSCSHDHGCGLRTLFFSPKSELFVFGVLSKNAYRLMISTDYADAFFDTLKRPPKA